MLDKYNRNINYLRVSVTDRCNLRCTYCMPAEGIELMDKNDVLTLEEICESVLAGVKKGITKVRLTGGEPLVREGITSLVECIAKIPEVEDLAMTTNGILLDKYAEDLAKAGLQRVNISLDTVSAEKFKSITRGGDINKVFDGINAARKAGLYPIKINCVVFKDKNEKDARDVARFCEENDLQVRFIHQMNLETGEFSIVEGGEGGDCKHCNRMRLTANGDFKPCLFNDMAFNIKNKNIETVYENAVNNKPKAGTKNKSGKFYGIGG